jgi:hypothetical protein
MTIDEKVEHPLFNTMELMFGYQLFATRLHF